MKNEHYLVSQTINENQYTSAKGYRRSFCPSAWPDCTGGNQLANASNQQAGLVAEGDWNLYFCYEFRASMSADGLNTFSHVSPAKKITAKIFKQQPWPATDTCYNHLWLWS